MAKILVIGSGAWGSALSNVLLENNHEVSIYGIAQNELSDLKQGVNKTYFGDKKFCGRFHLVSDDLHLCCQQRPDYILISVPSKVLNSVLEQLKKEIVKQCLIINTIKGLNSQTTNVWSEEIKNKMQDQIHGVVSLIGPSFAIEVFKKEMTIVNVACDRIEDGKQVEKIFSNNYFKCVVETDSIGAQFCAALKNVMAIACGLTYQLHLSINTRAAIFTQSIKEIYKIIQLKGGKNETILNFCGVGDIFLTCTNDLSRNFRHGQLLAKDVHKALEERSKTTVEGCVVLPIVHEIVKKNNLDAPVIESLYDVIHNNADPKRIVQEIFSKIKC